MKSLKDSIIMRFDYDILNICETGISFNDTHIKSRAHRGAPRPPTITRDRESIT